MSPRGYLRVIREDDGDIIVSVIDDVEDSPGFAGSVQFCVPMIGGGKSTHTMEALRALMIAMARDNKETPIAGNDKNSETMYFD